MVSFKHASKVLESTKSDQLGTIDLFSAEINHRLSLGVSQSAHKPFKV